MAKSRKLEEMLTLLAQVRDDPSSETAIAHLQQVLRSKQSIAIAQAAKLIGEFAIALLIPELTATFDRMMVKPTESDPGCLAKKEIAEALYRLDYGEESLFLQGIRHIQLEAIWGGKEDKAAALRGVCALGLVRMNYPQVMEELADLLADAKSEARITAARAIAYSENSAGIPLLRLRIKLGDEPAVLSEYLIALLKLAPQPSVPLVKNILYTRKDPPGLGIDRDIAEAAVLALGETRIPAAFDLLQEWWMQVRDPELRQTGLLAIAMLRTDAALDFLLSLIADGRLPDAQASIKALSLYQSDQALWQRVQQSATIRNDTNLII
jgi:hypothetical protein